MSKTNLNYQAQLSRHSHPTSAGYVSSLTAGCIVPQYFDILGPGDSIYYRTHMFARLQDVVTAFMGEIDLHLDYFFVPLQMLYTPFGQVFAQTNDLLSSVFVGTNSQREFVTTDKFPLLVAPDDVHLDDYYVGNSNYLWECDGKSIARLYDALDHNPFFIFNPNYYGSNNHTHKTSDVDEDLTYHPATAPWLFAAYQAIYQRFYRNEDFEHLNVAAYNFDMYYNQEEFHNFDFIQLRWHQRPSDYFTDIRVSPISSAINALGNQLNNVSFISDGGNQSSLSLLNDVRQWLSPEASLTDTFAGNQKFADGAGVYSSSPFNHVSDFVFDQSPEDSPSEILNTANIRALFALEKYQRIFGRAGKTYDDQILAHFGIKIPHDVKHDLTHLKHYRLVIQADPIFGTANTFNPDEQLASVIGQVGGQAQGTLDTDQEKFTAPVHGVFMCVAYVLTKPRYTSTFSKLHLLKDRLAFPIPEFDKLGAQPLYGFEFNRAFLSNSRLSIRKAWQNRYEEFKRKYDRCSFTYLDPNYNGHNPNNENVYSPWVLARGAYGVDGAQLLPATSSLIPAYLLFESPYNLNSIMCVPYDGSWKDDYYANPHLMFQTDPVITSFKCFAKKVSWMSETGEPDL